MIAFQLKIMIIEKAKELGLNEEELIILLDETIKLYQILLSQEKDVF